MMRLESSDDVNRMAMRDQKTAPARDRFSTLLDLGAAESYSVLRSVVSEHRRRVYQRGLPRGEQARGRMGGWADGRTGGPAGRRAAARAA